MKKNAGKRFLSMLLCVLMAVSMLPVSALALELPDLDVLQNAAAVVAGAEETEAETLDEVEIETSQDETLPETEEAAETGQESEPLLSSDVMASGVCGDDLTWTLDSAGVLTVSGTGPMWDFIEDGDIFDYHECPWLSYKDQIRHVVIGDGVTCVGAAAFLGYEALSHVDFGNTLEWIGHWAFMYCTALENFTLPESLTGLGQQAFDGCVRLTKVELPASLCFLDACVFQGCTGLTDVLIRSDPDLGAFIIGNCPFRWCTSLEEIRVEEGHIALSNPDGVLYSGDVLIQYPLGKKDRVYTVCSGTRSILQFAFEGAQNLQEVILPNGVTEIDGNAFIDCSNLIEVTIPNSVTYIDGCAFMRCDSLTDVYYTGSEAEWALINIEGDNECLTNATIHFNYVAPGDVTGDGSIDAVDLTHLMKGVVTQTVEYGAGADLNNDGTTDIQDIIRLIRWLAGEDVKLK